MDTHFKPIVDASVPCKCCGGDAKIYGVADFNQSCADIEKPLLPASGIPIYYHRCIRCGFIFTVAMDAFTHGDFQKWIYNDQYIQIDPDYGEKRAAMVVPRLLHMFRGSPEIRILDYGGGSGDLARMLRGHGFRFADTYDPFVPKFSARPSGLYDLILSFEMAEHVPRPAEIFADKKSLMSKESLIVFSTQFQPPDIDFMRMQWWYIAPRNGHVSIYTSAALQGVAQKIGLNFGSFDNCWHAMYGEIPAFARHLFPR
jgi:2-polyprenyl-6-hydroxyphenyl methylase/3-demethylubiquinone-9 3-methyltransferase